MSGALRSTVLVLGMLTAGCQAQNTQRGIVSLDVNVADFEMMMDTITNGLLLDVRTDNEFAQGHLYGARQIDFYRDDFSDELEKLDKEQPVFVYCKSGNRSGKAAKQMKVMGFTAVYNLEGGIGAWSKRGKPIAK